MQNIEYACDKGILMCKAALTRKYLFTVSEMILKSSKYF